MGSSLSGVSKEAQEAEDRRQECEKALHDPRAESGK